MRWWEAGLPGDDEATGQDRTVESDDERPSIMRQMLPPEDVERLEIEPGRWYLPGIPP
ncbi:hypothetical protein [Actinoplanes lobatus]|uniref:Uncharacterized protein n=1 Tax=Actinoplanes lobatus TaxID=113568 RepID=A0A7W7HRC5_9ACTN|nr:hypothetical protein [Actinoplanes lobatus]MBB4755285.1 hypothetical protein [Actinoplanes lobatus]GIE46429.1 hypothetical protein Alo02nite_93270 [Actinoplanes lobatus]